MMPQKAADFRNLLMALLLSMGILLVWQVTYEMPRRAAMQQSQAAQQAKQVAAHPQAAPAAAEAEMALSRPGRLAASPRLPIVSDKLHGSIALKGARFDDLSLARYRETVDPTSPEVVLLSPSGDPKGYFAEVGWVAATQGIKVPDAQSVWQADSDILTPGKPVTLRWDNGQGLTFILQVALDAQYMFTITQRVENNSATAVSFSPYAFINRSHAPEANHYAILHEGPLGVLSGTLSEISYDELATEGRMTFANAKGWFGITDKYWLAALVPGSDGFTSQFSHYKTPTGDDRYQVDYLGTPATVAPGAAHAASVRLFAGAKVIEVLDDYAEGGIPLFDRAVDFGALYFMTKPIFLALNYFYKLIGNFGLAILALTVLVKLIMYPLANKSYVAMNQMKRLQPQMQEIRERAGNDKMRMNQEIMALYKREKVNPMAGCLPLLIQIPVFFALYKVLFVTIEMRHTPFFGWIRDLSAPDPTNIFTLFGLLPWNPPSILHIGIWPLIMCVTMVLQQKMNPKPTDPVQAKMMAALPYVFVFLFGSFPAGLVIYWSWSNVLSILQQWFIGWRHGDKKLPAAKPKR